MARSGQIQRKVSEEELVSLLDQISQQEQKQTKTKIIFDQRRQIEDLDVTGSSKQDEDDDDFFD